jgi:integrase/recombinase XerC
MSVLRLTEAEWAAHYRADYAVPDKSYRRFPLGEDVGRFLRAKRVDGSPRTTIDSYEHTLRLLVLDHRDLTLADFEVGGTDLLYEFLARHWADAERSTIIQRKGALSSFFAWAEDTDRIMRNPARRLKLKRQSNRAKRRAHELATIKQIASAQDSVAHEVFILVMGRLGLRKMEAGSLRARDVDLKRDLLYLPSSKSGEPVEVLIEYEDVRRALDLWLREGRHPDEYLIAPRGHPRRRPNQATVHRRFKKCLERAGVESFPMHELRHSAADFLHRQTGDTSAAQKLLRHSSLKVTEDYLHPTHEDLRRRMREADK